jgi:hypothetical protein
MTTGPEKTRALPLSKPVYTERTTCRSCGSAGFSDVLSLGNQFIHGFISARDETWPRAPLDLVRCNQCGLLQLKRVEADLLEAGSVGYVIAGIKTPDPKTIIFTLTKPKTAYNDWNPSAFLPLVGNLMKLRRELHLVWKAMNHWNLKD